MITQKEKIVVAQVLPFIEHEQETAIIVRFVNVVLALHELGKIDILQQVFELSNRLNTQEILYVISIIARSSSENFEELRSHLDRFLQIFPKQDSARGEFLCLLCNTYPEQRVELMKDLFTILDGFEKRLRHSMLTAIAQMPETIGFARTSDMLKTFVDDPDFLQSDGLDRLYYLENVPDRLPDYIEQQDDRSYQLKGAQSSIYAAPQESLAILATHFAKFTASSINITFLDSKGVDVGGLGRQFVAKLIEALIPTMPLLEAENGLYKFSLRKKDGSIWQLNPKDIQTLNHLGQFMLFCLNARSDMPYPIGMHFDLGVFAGLTKVRFRHLEVSFDELVKNDKGFKELFGIYQAMNKYNEEDQKKIKDINEALSPLTKETSDKVLLGAFAVVEQDEEIQALGLDYDVDKIREIFPKIQAALKKYVIAELIKPDLIPLFEVAKGMRMIKFVKVLPVDVENMTAKELSERLQGTVDRNTILQNLQFEEEIPQEKAVWLKDWITNTTDAKLEQFLFAMTGAPALGKKGLQIKPVYDVDYIAFFHTCFNTLDFAFDTVSTKEDFFTHLEDAIKVEKFNLA